MECIALSPVHQIHQKYLRQQWMRFARSRSLVRAPAWFDCIKKPFFFNKPSAHSKNRCTYYCAMWFLERTNSVLFFASLCVLRGKIPHIKYLWFQQEWCDKVEKINNYAMLHSQHYHLCLCVCEWAQLLTVPHLFAAETIYHHVSVNNCTSKPTKNGSNERASTEQSANWRIFHSILLLQVSLFECASYKNDSPHTFISFTSPKREKNSCCMRIELRILFAFRIKISSLCRYFVYSFIYLVSFFASGKKKN